MVGIAIPYLLYFYLSSCYFSVIVIVQQRKLLRVDRPAATPRRRKPQAPRAGYATDSQAPSPQPRAGCIETGCRRTNFGKSRSLGGMQPPRGEQRRGGTVSHHRSPQARQSVHERPRCWPSRRRPRHAEPAGRQGTSTRAVGLQRRIDGGANGPLTTRVHVPVEENRGQSGRVGFSSCTGSDVEQTFTFIKRSSIAKQRRRLGAEPSDVGESVMAISVCGGTQ